MIELFSCNPNLKILNFQQKSGDFTIFKGYDKIDNEIVSVLLFDKENDIQRKKYLSLTKFYQNKFCKKIFDQFLPEYFYSLQDTNYDYIVLQNVSMSLDLLVEKKGKLLKETFNIIFHQILNIFEIMVGGNYLTNLILEDFFIGDSENSNKIYIISLAKSKFVYKTIEQNLTEICLQLTSHRKTKIYIKNLLKSEHKGLDFINKMRFYLNQYDHLDVIQINDQICDWMLQPYQDLINNVQQQNYLCQLNDEEINDLDHVALIQEIDTVQQQYAETLSVLKDMFQESEQLLRKNSSKLLKPISKANFEKKKNCVIFQLIL